METNKTVPGEEKGWFYFYHLFDLQKDRNYLLVFSLKGYHLVVFGFIFFEVKVIDRKVILRSVSYCSFIINRL